ncbi:MAG: HD domain-containing protein [Armatimonadota bacterium]
MTEQISGRKGLVVVVLVVLGLGFCTWLTYVAGGTNSPAVHFFYVPIICAGFFLGDLPAILVAVIAGFACGPFMAADYGTEPPVAQTPYAIILRLLFFYVIGYLAAWASRAIRQRAAEFQMLYEVAQSITSTVRLDHVLALIVNSALQVIDARAAIIRLLNPEGTELRMRAVAGLSKDYQSKGPVLVERSELDRRVLNGHHAAVANVQRDPRWQYPDAAADEGLSSVLTVALKTATDVKGVIRIYARVQRPFSGPEVELLTAFANQAAIAIENAELFENIRQGYYETVRALARAIEAKDPGTLGHSERVTELVTPLAKALGHSEDEVELIRFATVLHDIGKIGVSEQILEEGRELSSADELFIRMHPMIGKSILEPVEFLRPALDIVLHHHEQWDGDGYPEGLRGSDIPELARIVAVANAYDNMVHPTNGGTPIDEPEALRLIVREAGTKWDPEVVAEFNKMRMGGTQGNVAREEPEEEVAERD